MCGLPYHLLSLLRTGLKSIKRKHGIRLREPHSLLYLLQFVDREGNELAFRHCLTLND